MSEGTASSQKSGVTWWKPVLFSALAGGMAWGIRGQYGHESGAMIAGLLVSLTVTLLLCPRASSLSVARAVAWATIAMGFGGTMTYGQTIGLTQNPPVLGNDAAWAWGMLGLGIKGAIWIGFAGVFLGMGLGGVRYRARDLCLMMVALVAAHFLGSFWINTPFDPEQGKLPAVYFSAHWHWQPNTPIAELEPRPEYWGGLLAALVVAFIYSGLIRHDSLAWRLGLWGVLGGALGFPGGQMLQSYHAWHPEVFQQGLWVNLDPHMNWWNMMETTFGAIMGASLGLGAWIHRHRIRPAETGLLARWPAVAGAALLVVHVTLLVVAEFTDFAWVGAVYDLGLMMGIIPIVAVAAGRWWPYLMALPVTLLPIAGKTVQMVAYEAHEIDPAWAWMLYFVLPLTIVTIAAIWLGRQSTTGSSFSTPALLVCTWTLFVLNWAVFRFPWPWAEWTNRTPNGIIFAVCAAALTILAVLEWRARENVLAHLPRNEA